MYESTSASDNAPPGLADEMAEVLGCARAGLVTDVDGTISPIAARPEEARVLPGARQALEGLRDLLSLVAVVSGRSATDARRMVGLEGLTYIGNHGLEIWTDAGPTFAADVGPWVPRLAEVLDEIRRVLPDPGILIENKGASASLHYRLMANPDQVRQELLERVAGLALSRGLRLEEGRMVLNLLPPLSVTKGSAVAELAREQHLQAVVYLGDDLTDTHAFRTLRVLRETGQARTLSIGVLDAHTPASIRQLIDASVPSVGAVADLLSKVLERLRTSDSMHR